MPLRGVGGLPPLLSRLSWAASFRQRRLLSSCQCHLCSRAFTISLPPDFDTPSPPTSVLAQGQKLLLLKEAAGFWGHIWYRSGMTWQILRPIPCYADLPLDQQRFAQEVTGVPVSLLHNRAPEPAHTPGHCGAHKPGFLRPAGATVDLC